MHPPTGDPAYNLGMCPDWESNLQPFGLQASSQSTEPHQPELYTINFILLILYTQAHVHIARLIPLTLCYLLGFSIFHYSELSKNGLCLQKWKLLASERLKKGEKGGGEHSLFLKDLCH